MKFEIDRAEGTEAKRGLQRALAAVEGVAARLPPGGNKTGLDLAARDIRQAITALRDSDRFLIGTPAPRPAANLKCPRCGYEFFSRMQNGSTSCAKCRKSFRISVKAA